MSFLLWKQVYINLTYTTDISNLTWKAKYFPASDLDGKYAGYGQNQRQTISAKIKGRLQIQVTRLVEHFLNNEINHLCIIPLLFPAIIFTTLLSIHTLLVTQSRVQHGLVH